MSYSTALTERLITTLFKLARRAHSRQELAREFQVNPKTISHDIDALSREHPIESFQEGRETYYRFQAGYTYTVPTLTPEELATMLLAQESIAGLGLTAAGSPYAKYADSLLQKVRAALPRSVQRRMDALAAVYGSAAVPAKNFTPHLRTIDALTSAAIDCRRVLLRYQSFGQDAPAARLVEPYAVYFDPDGATLKLIGYDHKRGAIRAFSIDHIRDLTPTTEKFTRPESFHLREYLAEHCFNGIHGPPVTVCLRAHGVTARIFAERRFHPSQRIVAKTRRTASKPESITIELRVAGGRGLVRFILGWVPDIEVLAPAEVRAQVQAALADGAARHLT